MKHQRLSLTLMCGDTSLILGQTLAKGQQRTLRGHNLMAPSNLPDLLLLGGPRGTPRGLWFLKPFLKH